MYSLSWRSVWKSFCSHHLPTVIGRVKVGMTVKYISVINNGHFYCSFGPNLVSTIFLCANHIKIPYFDREIIYVDFVGGHLASAETEWPQIIQVTKWIQVASNTFKV
jgi:hypothetical protein